VSSTSVIQSPVPLKTEPPTNEAPPKANNEQTQQQVVQAPSPIKIEQLTTTNTTGTGAAGGIGAFGSGFKFGTTSTPSTTSSTSVPATTSAPGAPEFSFGLPSIFADSNNKPQQPQQQQVKVELKQEPIQSNLFGSAQPQTTTTTTGELYY